MLWVIFLMIFPYIMKLIGEIFLDFSAEIVYNKGKGWVIIGSKLTMVDVTIGKSAGNLYLKKILMMK